MPDQSFAQHVWTANTSSHALAGRIRYQSQISLLARSLPQRVTRHRFLARFSPATILLSSVTLVLLPDDTSFLAAALIGSANAVLITYVFCKDPFGIRWSVALADGLLLGYVLGALNTILQTGVGPSLASLVGRDVTDLCRALALVMAVCGVLIFCGYVIEPPVFKRRVRLSRREYNIIWIGIALMLAAYFRGAIGYMGATPGADHHVSPLGALAAWAVVPVTAMTTLACLEAHTQSKRTVYVLLWLAEFMMVVPQGRRVVLYAVLINIIAANLSIVRLRFSIFQKLAILSLLVVLGASSFVAFYALRMARIERGKHFESLSSTITRASRIVSGDTRSGMRLALDLKRNVAKRTFILSYFNDLLIGSSTVETLHGEDAWRAFRMAIPSLIYRDKQELAPAEEVQANSHFGLVTRDEANSILTAGVIDFGIVGVFLYPTILAAMVCFYLHLAEKILPLWTWLIALCLLSMLIQAEVEIPMYFQLFRDTFLFTVLLAILRTLPAIQIFRPLPTAHASNVSR